MDEEELDFGGESENEVKTGRGDEEISDIKYHVWLKGLSLEGRTRGELLNLVISEVERSVGPVQPEFVQIKRDPDNPDKAMVKLGMKYDAHAQHLYYKKVKLNLPLFGKQGFGMPKVDPTDVFVALLQRQVAQRDRRARRSSSHSRHHRSRSPRNSSPSLLILCPPKQVKDSEILQELSNYRIQETPRIEYIFTNIPELDSGLIIKLSFRHMHSVEQLADKEITLKGKTVLVFQPSLKNDIDKSVKHALQYHQVCVKPSDMDVPTSVVREALEEFGKIVHFEPYSSYFIVTFALHRSAREALKREHIENGSYTLNITKQKAS